MAAKKHASDSSSSRKVIISGMIGNGLEWYDFALYAQMSFILSELFFPGEDESVKLIATFGVFAVGFLFRPLGAILFGYIGDRYGRKTSLVIAIMMMAIPTGCIGLLPTYEQIGIMAPVLLTVIRVFQGLSLGGEFSGSITYMVEHSKPSKRGLAGSASIVSLILGFLMGSFVALLFVEMLSPEDFRSWGWRVPFILGVFIGLVGLFIRSHCEESPTYLEAKHKGDISERPLRTLFSRHKSAMLQAFLLYISVTMPFYLIGVYLISFTERKIGLPVNDALLINAMAMLLMMITSVIGAALSDRVGRKPVLAGSAFALMVAIVPIFVWMESGVYMDVLLAQLLFGFILGFYIGPMPAVLVEMFPTSIRYTGMALSYNMAAVLFGGTTPMVAEWLIRYTSMHHSVAFYVMACNAVSLIALYFFTDHMRRRLS